MTKIPEWIYGTVDSGRKKKTGKNALLSSYGLEAYQWNRVCIVWMRFSSAILHECEIKTVKVSEKR